MAKKEVVITELSENLASLSSLSQKWLVDWNLKLGKILGFFHNFRKEDLIGLMNKTHEVVKKKEVADISSKQTSGNLPFVTSHLTEIYHDEEIFIEECGDDTKESGLYYAKDLFPGYLSSNLKNWNIINPQPKTKKMKVLMFELNKDGDFQTIFLSCNKDLKSLCMTQAQIINFCVTNGNKILKYYYSNMFFLFSENKNFFVASVYLHDGCLKLNVCEFEDDFVWFIANKPRIVVPATAVAHLKS